MAKQETAENSKNMESALSVDNLGKKCNYLLM